MHKRRFLSEIVEDSEPTKTQNFTDLLAELRMAQVNFIRILPTRLLQKFPYVKKVCFLNLWIDKIYL